MRNLKLSLVALLLLLSLLSGAAIANAASPYTCTGGAIPAGTYSSLTIAGVCSIPSGTVTVLGDVTVLPGKALNAAVMNLFTGQQAGSLVVMGDLIVQKNAALALGCAPSLPCAGKTDSRVEGTLRGDEPLAMLVHGNAVGGHVSVQGGGGGVSCAPNALVNEMLGVPPDFPFQFPAYTTFEGNEITGGISVMGLNSCWFGTMRNTVTGSVVIRDNTMADPDAMEIVTNKVGGSLVCFDNSPAPQIGDSEGEQNIVKGRAVGQCATIK